MGMEYDENGKPWVTDEELKSIRMDRQYLVGLHGEGPTQAQAILNEASPAAAMQLVKLALHAESESVRLNASRYILDKTVGDGGEVDPWQHMQDTVVKDVDKYLAEQAGKMGPPQ